MQGSKSFIMNHGFWAAQWPSWLQWFGRASERWPSIVTKPGASQRTGIFVYEMKNTRKGRTKAKKRGVRSGRGRGPGRLLLMKNNYIKGGSGDEAPDLQTNKQVFENKMFLKKGFLSKKVLQKKCYCKIVFVWKNVFKGFLLLMVFLNVFSSKLFF